MPTHTLSFHIAVIGPSDTADDIIAVRNAVNQLTREFTIQGVTLLFHHWMDLAPGLGKSAQKYIDQNVCWADMDYVIGLLWRRFGTPAEGAASGTEHEYREIYRLFSARKQPDLLFYFRDVAPNDRGDDREQIEKFKREIQASALTGRYVSVDELQTRVRDDLRQKITAKLLLQNQYQRRIGKLPPNRRITVEMIIFAEFPSEEVLIPVIVILKNFRGEEFDFDTRSMYPQELANWIASSMGFAATPGRTLRSYLDECNKRNYEAVADSQKRTVQKTDSKKDPFTMEKVEASVKPSDKSLVITQFWLGNILFADHPGLKLKEFKIALGHYTTKEKLKEGALKNSGRYSIHLPRPQIQNDNEGRKRIIL
jgi:hypothetical protein